MAQSETKTKLGKTLIIANPAARNGKGAEGADFVERFLGSYHAATKSFEVYRTKAPGDGRKRAQKASTFDTVIALGGDGLIHEVVTGLMAIPDRLRPRLGVIPMGSGNDYARTLHLAINDPTAALGQIVNGTAVPMDLGKVNGQWFCETCSFGLDAAIALDTMATRTPDGPQGTRLFAKSGVKIFKQMDRGYRFTASIDGGEPFSGEEIVFACQVGPTYGGGFRICPDASPVDGMLDLCYNTKIPSKPTTLLLFASAKPGLHAKTGVVELVRFKRLTVEFEEEPPAQIDGEPLHGTGFTVECVPAALDVIVPNSFKWHPNPVVERPNVADGLLGTKLAGKLRGEA